MEDNTMKKNLMRAMMAAMAALSLTACGTKAVCDFCGEEKTCQEKTVFGETLMICGDCTDELQGLN